MTDTALHHVASRVGLVLAPMSTKKHLLGKQLSLEPGASPDARYYRNVVLNLITLGLGSVAMGVGLLALVLLQLDLPVPGWALMLCAEYCAAVAGFNAIAALATFAGSGRGWPGAVPRCLLKPGVLACSVAGLLAGALALWLDVGQGSMIPVTALGVVWIASIAPVH